MGTDKNTGTVITLKEAIDFTHAFQYGNPASISAFLVGANKINLILEQKDCIGIRIYNGHDNVNNKNNLVLIGVDVNGKDMTEGVIVERLFICPPICPDSSLLIDS